MSEPPADWGDSCGTMNLSRFEGDGEVNRLFYGDNLDVPRREIANEYSESDVSGPTVQLESQVCITDLDRRCLSVVARDAREVERLGVVCVPDRPAYLVTSQVEHPEGAIPHLGDRFDAVKLLAELDREVSETSKFG